VALIETMANPRTSPKTTPAPTVRIDPGRKNTVAAT
jgi:hypothetical protein